MPPSSSSLSNQLEVSPSEDRAKVIAAERQEYHQRAGRPERPDPAVVWQHSQLQYIATTYDQLISRSKGNTCRTSWAKQSENCKADTAFSRPSSFHTLKVEDSEFMDQILPSKSRCYRNSNPPDLRVSSQHPMEQREDILHIGRETEDSNNDSGFGSGGWGPAPEQVVDCDNDFQKLQKNEEGLKVSCIYHAGIDSPGAKRLLRNQPIGTFLIRDSSDPRFLYSLSIVTEHGATSVRIFYRNGLFQFDSDERIRNKLPQFDSVLSLVDFHVMITQGGGNKSWRWEETSGNRNMRVMLVKPLRSSVPSLAHLARVKINQCLDNLHFPELSVDKLPLIPVACKTYLKEYPYRL